MFYALAHEKIPMRGFKIEHVIEDIESLNQRALGKGQADFRKETAREPVPENPPAPLEVTAVSCHAYAYLAESYAVMRSGASVGDNYGPILVAASRRATKLRGGNLHEAFGPCRAAKPRVAVPGKLTTAYLVFQLYAATAEADIVRDFETVLVPFDKIFDAVKSGEADYGLVIHEGQITHEAHGLGKVLDLGEWWHGKTGLPLPLGVDVIRKDLGEQTMREFSALFKESIEYALNHREDALKYALQFGRGTPWDLNDRFVGMYVNERTVDIGADGEAGFRRLLDEAHRHGIIPRKVELKFI